MIVEGAGNRSNHSTRFIVSWTVMLPVVLGLALALVSLFVFVRPALASTISSTPDAGTIQTDGQIRAILLVGDRIYIGGGFRSVNGVARNRLAAIDANTGQLTPWKSAANKMVRSLAASPDRSRIYVGGDFTTIKRDPRNHVAALDAATGALDQSWNASTDLPVYSLATLGGRVYIGGQFTAVNGQRRSNLVAVDGVTGAIDPAWNADADGLVRTLTLSPDRTSLYVGGHFSKISGVARNRLAQLSTDTGAPSPWAPNPCYPVYEVEVVDTSAYVAGGGTPAGCNAGGWGEAFSTDSGARLWSHSSEGDFQAVTYLEGTVYFGGHYTEIPFVPAPGHGERWVRFAAVDAASGLLDAQWKPEAYPGVWAMEADPLRRRIYAGGEFTEINRQPQVGFAQFSGL